jgi:acetyl-CoA/propionyl-CoA carboxylase biotin carboxyl carrier protein
MNTRIQVEHTVTELVTGLDLVREQVLVAAGEPLSFAQKDVRLSGHAIECRINAEDPRKGFLPAPGTIGAYREPAGPGVRIDSGVTEGSEIVGIYDPLVAKLVVWDVDRERARRRMLRALDEYVIEGVTTLVGFHRALLEHPCFVAGETCFGLVEQIAEQVPEERPAARTAASGRAQEQVVGVELDGRRYDVAVLRPEPPHAELARRRRERTRDGAHHSAAREAVVSPMQGTVLAVEVQDGDEVREGQVVCVVEAMKMENEITAHRPGVVSGLSVAEGEPVSTGQVICVVEQKGDGTADDSL